MRYHCFWPLCHMRAVESRWAKHCFFSFHFHFSSLSSLSLFSLHFQFSLMKYHCFWLLSQTGFMESRWAEHCFIIPLSLSILLTLLHFHFSHFTFSSHSWHITVFGCSVRLVLWSPGGRNTVFLPQQIILFPPNHALAPLILEWRERKKYSQTKTMMDGSWTSAAGIDHNMQRLDCNICSLSENIWDLDC